jgi:SAM-dependent methyltransferase
MIVPVMADNSALYSGTARLEALREWCRQPLGRHLAEAEQAALCEVLCNVFGYHLVVIDPSCEIESLEESRIIHRIVQTRSRAGLVRRPDLLSSSEKLPYCSDSVDAFVLPHALDVAQDPHQVLREIDRCLIAEGHLIVLGFNPYGWWGLRRVLGGKRRGSPWGLRFIGLSRLKDWLSLLGFDTVRMQYLFPSPPWTYGLGRDRWGILDRLHRDHWPLLAASYLLVAKKRVATLTPIKPRWRPRRAILADGVIESRDGGLPGHG